MHRWQRVAEATGLTGPDGVVRPTVFAEMSALAVRTGAVNLGQGFPDVDGPEHIVEAAVAALRGGHNQYPPGGGIPELRAAVAAHQQRHYGLEVDPATQVLVTTGATEALAAAVLALVGAGDEVLTLEPFYDSYAAVIAMAGARHVTAPLVRGPGRVPRRPGRPRGGRRRRGPGCSCSTPRTTRRAPCSPGPSSTRSPPWPARTTCSCSPTRSTSTWCSTTPATCRSPTLPGMAERTLTVSSAGKTLSFTGWKVGWLTGPAGLVAAVRTVQQYLTYASGAPFQPAVAAALRDDDGATGAWVRGLATSLAARRDLLCEGLVEAGFDVVVPRGTYFVVADGAGLGFDDGVELCRALPELAGVVGVPVSAFCLAGSPTADALRSRVRFTFVKREEVLARGVAGLRRLASRERP